MRFKDIFTNILLTIPCHRKPERCLHIKGKPMLICSRCFSMLMGYLFIPLLFLLPIPIPFNIGIMCQIPMIIDGYTQKKKLRTSNNYLRVITGLTSGFGLSVIIVCLVRILSLFLIGR